MATSSCSSDNNTDGEKGKGISHNSKNNNNNSDEESDITKHATRNTQFYSTAATVAQSATTKMTPKAAPMSHDEREERRRETNRLSKRKCRGEKRELIRSYQQQLQLLTDEYRDLTNENKKLRTELHECLHGKQSSDKEQQDVASQREGTRQAVATSASAAATNMAPSLPSTRNSLRHQVDDTLELVPRKRPPVQHQPDAAAMAQTASASSSLAASLAVPTQLNNNNDDALLLLRQAIMVQQVIRDGAPLPGLDTTRLLGMTINHNNINTGQGTTATTTSTAATRNNNNRITGGQGSNSGSTIDDATLYSLLTTSRQGSNNSNNNGNVTYHQPLSSLHQDAVAMLLALSSPTAPTPLPCLNINPFVLPLSLGRGRTAIQHPSPFALTASSVDMTSSSATLNLVDPSLLLQTLLMNNQRTAAPDTIVAAAVAAAASAARSSTAISSSPPPSMSGTRYRTVHVAKTNNSSSHTNTITNSPDGNGSNNNDLELKLLVHQQRLYHQRQLLLLSLLTDGASPTTPISSLTATTMTRPPRRDKKDQE